MALERATPARLATSVASETSSGSNTRPGPSRKVMTPMTSPLAVSGTASAVDEAERVGLGVGHGNGGQLGAAGAVGHGGRRIGVEGNRLGVR